MIDQAMLHLLCHQIGMKNIVVDANSLKLAQAIWKAASSEERDACIKSSERREQEARAKCLQEIIAEWGKPYGLTDGTRFEERLRRMLQESTTGKD